MRKRILVIDDDPILTTLLERILSIFEYDFDFIPNGELIFEKLKSSHFDLILLDIKLPGKDGVTILKELKAHPVHSSVPVIMLTSQKEDLLLFECFEIGAADYITKPFKKLVIKSRIKTALAIKNEQERYRLLMENTFPKKIANDLLKHGISQPQYFPCVSIGFTDFVGFTSIASTMTPKELVDRLGSYFDYFDEIISRRNLEKIKTIGDGYMFAGGLPTANDTHAIDCISAAMEIQQFIKKQTELYVIRKQDSWDIRIGIHTGPVVAGVIGRNNFAYDIWGDAVNVASRMESSGRAGSIQISEETYQQAKEYFICETRSKVKVKGKGFMNTYLVKSRKD